MKKRHPFTKSIFSVALLSTFPLAMTKASLAQEDRPGVTRDLKEGVGVITQRDELSDYKDSPFDIDSISTSPVTDVAPTMTVDAVSDASEEYLKDHMGIAAKLTGGLSLANGSFTVDVKAEGSYIDSTRRTTAGMSYTVTAEYKTQNSRRVNRGKLRFAPQVMSKYFIANSKGGKQFNQAMWPAYILEYGDRFVESVDQGAYVMITYNIDFGSEEAKKIIEAGASLDVTLLMAKLHAEGAFTSDKASAVQRMSIRVKAIQRGGSPAGLTTVIGKGTCRPRVTYAVESDRPASAIESVNTVRDQKGAAKVDLSECDALIKAGVDYITKSFPAQLGVQAIPSVPETRDEEEGAPTEVSLSRPASATASLAVRGVQMSPYSSLQISGVNTLSMNPTLSDSATSARDLIISAIEEEKRKKANADRWLSAKGAYGNATAVAGKVKSQVTSNLSALDTLMKTYWKPTDSSDAAIAGVVTAIETFQKDKAVLTDIPWMSQAPGVLTTKGAVSTGSYISVPAGSSPSDVSYPLIRNTQPFMIEDVENSLEKIVAPYGSLYFVLVDSGAQAMVMGQVKTKLPTAQNIGQVTILCSLDGDTSPDSSPAKNLKPVMTVGAYEPIDASGFVAEVGAACPVPDKTPAKNRKVFTAVASSAKTSAYSVRAIQVPMVK